ncbi:hypothetical protein [Salinibaculum rarum]|uniref:hypothetical protein n=1 Tax=Salinibaculum rarum TaxID=3058903 RepID=UPI00265FC3F2|nr:hypothetical protein [Salinibaculum sp. KK48]
MQYKQHLIEERQRIPFAGLTPKDNGEIPASIASRLGKTVSTSPDATFKDIIQLLPEANAGDLKSVNDFVNTDGTVDVERIKDIFDTRSVDFDIDDLSVNPELIDDADRLVDVTDYVDVVDDRRKALDALGYDTKYRWQIATDSYTIINPAEAYYPAQRTFREEGEADDIFGWASIRNYGGEIDLYVLFNSQTIHPPQQEDANDNRDRPIYMGIQTGYNFTGGRAFDSRLFGFDAERGTWMYGLGPRNSRRHVGEKDDATKDIREWWSDEYDRILTYTDELLQDITRAESITIDFKDTGYDIVEFFDYLADIPEDYAEPAAKLAKAHSDDLVVTAWTLSHSLLTSLESNFEGQGDSDVHASATFRAYAEIASNIVRQPQRQIRKVETEYQKDINRAQAKQEVNPEQVTLADTNIDEIDAVDTSHQPQTLAEKGDTMRRQQKKLLNF